MIEMLKYVNKYAFYSNKKKYLLCLLLYILGPVNLFITLSYSEYNINAAYYLLKGEATLSEIMPKIIIFLVAIVSFQILVWFQSIVENKLIFDVKYKYEKELNEQLSNIRWDYYESHSAFMKIKESQTQSKDVLVELIQKSMLLFSIFPIIFVYSYFLSRIRLVIVLLFLITAIIFNRFSNKLKAGTTNLWEEIRPFSQRQRYFFEICGDKVTHQEYQFNRLSKYVIEKWEESYNTEVDLRMQIYKGIELRTKIAQLLAYLPRFLMLIYITIGIVNGTYEVGFFVMINTMLAQFTINLTKIQEIREVYRTKYSFINSFCEVMKYEKQSTIKSADKNDLISNEVLFNDVMYCYPQSKHKALNGLNLEIKKGEKIAIVGINGSGKTTAMNLILALTNPEEGYVNTWPLSRISVIFQDFTQYQATIKENIIIGNPMKSLSDEDVWRMLEMVGLKEKVQSLPDGINTKLGQLEKGIELSKGQWQRVAIARLLANPFAEMWILDEPTAYLDPVSEIEIYNLIYELADNRTVLFISHRLGFARKADRIVLFENGKIAENGTHDELIKKKGVYAEMFEMQKSWYEC